MRKTILFICAWLLLVPSVALASPKAAYVWVQLQDGLSYATYSFSNGERNRTTIHAFQIDPKKLTIDVAVAADEQSGMTAREMARMTGALVAINGGFFTPQHTSIGLIIKEGKTINPLHKTSWWSIFALTGTKPRIISPRDFKKSDETTTALQVGPRLAIDGKMPKLKEGLAARSAVGIDRNGTVVIAMSTGNGISLKEMARRMSASRFQGGLECPNAMALDGGSSSQLYAKSGSFDLSLPNMARVTNGLIVLPRKSK